MKDLLHDHLAFGFHEGCPSCDQVKGTFRNQGLVPRVHKIFTVLSGMSLVVGRKR